MNLRSGLGYGENPNDKSTQTDVPQDEETKNVSTQSDFPVKETKNVSTQARCEYLIEVPVIVYVPEDRVLGIRASTVLHVGTGMVFGSILAMLVLSNRLR